MSLFKIYNFAKAASKSAQTPTTWMFVKQHGSGWNGWTADENTVRLLDRAEGCLIAFRFDNGEKTVGLHI